MSDIFEKTFLRNKQLLTESLKVLNEKEGDLLHTPHGKEGSSPKGKANKLPKSKVGGPPYPGNKRYLDVKKAKPVGEVYSKTNLPYEIVVVEWDGRHPQETEVKSFSTKNAAIAYAKSLVIDEDGEDGTEEGFSVDDLTDPTMGVICVTGEESGMNIKLRMAKTAKPVTENQWASQHPEEARTNRGYPADYAYNYEHDIDPAGAISDIVRDLFKSGAPTLSYEKICYEGSGAYKHFDNDEYILQLAKDEAERFGYTDNEETEEFVKTGEPLPPDGKWEESDDSGHKSMKWVPNEPKPSKLQETADFESTFLRHRKFLIESTKQLMKEYEYDNNTNDHPTDMSWVSTCCGAPCQGHLEPPRAGISDVAEGICSQCKEHADFEQEEDYEKWVGPKPRGGEVDETKEDNDARMCHPDPEERQGGDERYTKKEERKIAMDMAKMAAEDDWKKTHPHLKEISPRPPRLHEVEDEDDEPKSGSDDDWKEDAKRKYGKYQRGDTGHGEAEYNDIRTNNMREK